AGGAALGEEVTMSATVASATTATNAATGVVEFRDGGDKVGEVALAAGVATFATTTLALGEHQLTARYRCDCRYKPSDSGVPLTYTINASPVFDVAVPSSVRIGGDPVTFPVILENPSVGTAIANAGLNVVIQRGAPGGFSSDRLDPDDVLLERQGA